MRDNNSEINVELQRLKDAVGAKTDTALAQFLGITQGSISSARKRKRIPLAWIKKTALHMNMASHPLLFGEKQMELSPKTGDIVTIPVVNATLSAGDTSFEKDGNANRYLSFEHAFLCRKGSIKDMVLLTVAGDSMEPEIKDKDTVLIDQSQTRFMANAIYAVSIENIIYLKRINSLPGKIILESINPKYPPISIEPCELKTMKILGRALWWCREME